MAIRPTAALLTGTEVPASTGKPRPGLEDRDLELVHA
jgi:hypothetical protein